MTTDTVSTVRPPGFYDSELYINDIEYLVFDEDVEPLPSLDQSLLKEVAARMLTCVAAIAVFGMVTVAEAAATAISEPVGPAPHVSGPGDQLDLRTMTNRMRENAGFAARLFQRTPHPGSDEPDPDYGI